MSKIYNLINGYKRISIIGMGKNVGKTTVLNKIISNVGDKKKIALTSIGRDGEEEDLVTKTSKPKIYIYKGTIIATAKECLNLCDITKEILDVTNFSTPMGNIIILRALSDGYVYIAGPSFNSQIIKVVEKMEKFGGELTLIDGALGRKGSAANSVCDGVILVTGASYSNNMNEVIESTINTVKLFEIPIYNGIKNLEKIIKNTEDYRAIFFYKDGTFENIKEPIFLESSEKLKKYLQKEVSLILIKGAITDNSIEIFIKNRNYYKDLEIIAIDGTKFFLTPLNYKKAELSGIKFKVIKKIKLIFVACNPVSQTGYFFKKLEFKKALSERLDYVVLDVLDKE
ncbi:MAG: hypothetical protein ACRC6K_04190 [Fusobacteriaceae bacterium]